MAQSITDINGVYASAIEAGIKCKGLDLGLLYVPNAVAAAAVFTQHKFKASSVSYTQKCLKRYTLKAMIINSGNANAVTGKQGNLNTKLISRTVFNMSFHFTRKTKTSYINFSN